MKALRETTCFVGFFTLFAASLFAGEPASLQYTYVQALSGTTITSTAMNFPVAAGNSIVGYAWFFTTTIGPITTSQNDACAVVSNSSVASSVFTGVIFLCPNVVGGANYTVTINLGASSAYSAIYAAEYAGVLTADVAGQNHAGTGTNLTLSSNLTPSSANELVFAGGILYNNSSANFSPEGAFNLRFPTPAGNYTAIADQFQTSATAVKDVFLASASNEWMVSVATFTATLPPIVIPQIISTTSYLHTAASSHSTGALNTTGASSIVVVIGTHNPWNSNPVTVNSIMDTAGNIFNLLLGPVTGMGVNFPLTSIAYYVTNPIMNAADVITVNLSNAAPMVINVYAFQGSVGTPIVSGVNSPASGMTSTSVTSGPITVPANTLLVQWFKSENFQSTASSSGFVLGPGVSSTNQGDGYLWGGWAPETNSGSYSGNFTIGTASYWQSFVIGLSGSAPADLTVTKTDNVNGTTTLGNNWTWTITVTNAGNGSASFATGNTVLTDNLPNSNITYGTVMFTPVSGITGTVACSIASGNLSCSASGAVMIAAGGSFTVSFMAIPSALGAFANPRTGGICQVDPNNLIMESTSNQTCSDTVLVVSPPSITKMFNPPAILPGGTSTLSIQISNANPATMTGVAVQDPLPAGLVASPSTLVSTCNGSTTVALVGSNWVINLSGGSIAPGSSCGITVSVTAAAEGVYNNLTGQVNSMNDGAGNTASASLTVSQSPTLTMTFSDAAVPQGANVNLTFTLTSSNQSYTITGVSFTDPLPAGLRISTPNGLTTTCTGAMIIATAGTQAIDVNDVSLAPQTSCTITVSVAAIGLGMQVNTTSMVTTDPAPPGNPATATIFIGNAFEIGYASNLSAGDSFIDITSDGSAGGDICVNVYAFDPGEELVSCCACNLTRNALQSLSVKSDLLSNALTPGIPASLVVALVATPNPGGTVADCNAAADSALAPSLQAWATTIHSTPTGAYRTTETPFSPATLSVAEFNHLTQFCDFAQSNGSGYGICKSCQAGGLGAAKQ